MSVQVYGCNHIAIEVDDVEAAVRFYQDVFNLEKMDGGEGDAFLKLVSTSFSIFEVERVKPTGSVILDSSCATRNSSLRCAKGGGEVCLKLEPRFRCDFRDPWGNRIQVVDLHDESLIWLLPMRSAKSWD